MSRYTSEVSDDTIPENHRGMGAIRRENERLGAIHNHGHQAPITTFNTLWFTDHRPRERSHVAQDEGIEVEGGEAGSDTTLCVVMQTDEAWETEDERSMKVYLRLSLNGVKQYDIPAKRIEGLNDTFVVSTVVPPGKNVALIQMVKTWQSGYTGLEVAPNMHIVDIERDTLLHVKWREETHKIIMPPNQPVIFVLEGPSDPPDTPHPVMRSIQCWMEDAVSQYVMRFPASGTLVAVPVQPREDSRESQLVHRVLSGGMETSGGWEARPGVEHTTTTVHLSTLAHSNILVSRWNEPEVHITEVELTTRGFLVDQTDQNILQVLKGTTEMYLAKNNTTAETRATYRGFHAPSTGDLSLTNNQSDQGFDQGVDIDGIVLDEYSAFIDFASSPHFDFDLGANVSIVDSPITGFESQVRGKTSDGLVNDNMSAAMNETTEDEEAVPVTTFPDSFGGGGNVFETGSQNKMPTGVEITIVVDNTSEGGFDADETDPPQLNTEDAGASVTVASDTMLPDADNENAVAGNPSNESLPLRPQNTSVSAAASVNMSLATVSATTLPNPSKTQQSKDRIKFAQKMDIDSDTTESTSRSTAYPATEATTNEASVCAEDSQLPNKTPHKTPSKGLLNLFCACRGSKHQDN